ncbi:acyl-CoA N-acyltransferase [Pyronema omphalodes]|nr:acyl-CoA N-acyltransferase [Pyronema omphalodes]
MYDPNFSIDTPRLTLSHFLPDNPEHCTFLVELYNSPLFLSTEGQTTITTPEAAKKLLATRFIDEHKRNGYGTYLVSLKVTKKPIGSVSLIKGNDPASFEYPDIGFALIPDMVGKGYATEAAKAMLDFTGVKEYFGFTDPDNVPSIKVLERLGMVRHGIRKLKPFGGREGLVYTAPGMGELTGDAWD